MPASCILVVDDDAAIRFGLRDFLEAKGYEVEEAASCEAAEDRFKRARPDVAILDYSLPDGTALDLLERLRAVDSAVPLLVLTGHGSIDLAVQAIKLGAEQFLTKPVELPALVAIIERLLENRRNRRRQAAQASLQARSEVDPFAGKSAAMQRLAGEAQRVADAELPVLILGETGTGKGVLARWLHNHGPRAAEPFVDLNCAGLTRELLESELFGHERGAFTGAVARKLGLLEVANGGTLFLDEIGDIDPAVQPKLLKVLEEKTFRRLGEVRDRTVDVRLVAATHHDLSTRVREGAFRGDLYFRISTIPLRLPALRERTEDLRELVAVLLARLGVDLGRGGVSLSAAAWRALESYRWPGNIRELRNVLERALLLSDGRELGVDDLRFEAPANGWEDGGDLTLEELERRHIERVLAAEGGRVARAAERLGIARSSLYEKIRRHGLRSSER